MAFEIERSSAPTVAAAKNEVRMGGREVSGNCDDAG